jgi:hypothetical protein
MNYSQSQTSEPIIVPTARWVVLVMLLIAMLASAALLLSWRDFKYADNTRKALIGNIQTIRDSYDPVLASVQQQLREAQAKNRDLQGELSILTDRLQFAQNEVELARRQTRQWTRRSNSN